MAKPTRNILIVDDDPIITAIYQKKFAESGFVVRVAHNATEAVVALPEFKPDIVLLDLNMPGRGGAELLNNLRAVPRYRDLPVVIVTGEPADSPQLAAATRSAVTGVLHKDQWNPEAVLDAVRWALGQPQRKAARQTDSIQGGTSLEEASRRASRW